MIQMLPTELSDMTTQHISLRGYSGKYTDLSRPASDTCYALSCSMQSYGFVSYPGVAYRNDALPETCMQNGPYSVIMRCQLPFEANIRQWGLVNNTNTCLHAPTTA